MDAAALAALRRSYELAGLDVADVDPDPIAPVRAMARGRVAAELIEPNAMVLATADGPAADRRARTLLLKAADERGFTFFTNYGSTKGRHLAENPQASMCFPWIELERQVTVTGAVEKVSENESAEYFRSRPHGSRLGAWTSRQSEVIASRCGAGRAATPSSPIGTRTAPRCRYPSSGAATDSSPTRSSSGKDARTGCTTASATARSAWLDDRAAVALIR